MPKLARLGLAALVALAPLVVAVLPAQPASASESCSMAVYGDLDAHYKTYLGDVTRRWYVAQWHPTFNGSSPHRVNVTLRSGTTRINDKRVRWSVGGSAEVEPQAWTKAFASAKVKIQGQYARNVGSYLEQYRYSARSATYRIPHGQTIWWQGGARYTVPFRLKVCDRGSADWRLVRKGTFRAHWSTVDPSVPDLFQSTRCGVAADNALERYVTRSYCVS